MEKFNIEHGVFHEIVNGWNPLYTFVRTSILDVWQGSEYASEFQTDSFWVVLEQGKGNAIASLIQVQLTLSWRRSLSYRN